MGIFDERQIKWTIRLVRGLQLMLGALIIYCVWRYQSSLNPYFSGTLLFTSILSTIFIFALAAVEKGLQYKKHYSWPGARCVGILGLATPLFPLALLSLAEVFNSKTSADFYQTKTIYSDVPLSTPTKLSLIALIVLCVTGGGLYFQFQKNSAFLDVAFKESTYKLPPNSSIKELYEIAGDCNAYGKTRCAVAAFIQILKQSPGDTKALANLAMAQSHYKQHSLAIANFKKVLAKGYNTHDVYYFYGKSLKATKFTEPALNAYYQALNMNPDQVEAAAEIALILVEKEKFKEALHFIQKYLDQNPDAMERFRAVQDNLEKKVQDV